MASQLMADETERSSSLSSSEPRRPRMKRPNGDWRRLPRERDRWRRLPRLLLGEALGTQLVCAPGAVVDMVEPMFFFCFLLFSFVLMSFGSACCSAAPGEHFCGRALLALRFYVRRGSFGRAVLGLCALSSRTTAVKQGPPGL